MKNFLHSLSFKENKRDWESIKDDVSVSGKLSKDTYSCYRKGTLLVKGRRYKRSTKAINSVVLVSLNSTSFVFQIDYFTVEQKCVYFHGIQIKTKMDSIAPGIIRSSKMAVVEEECSDVKKVDAEFIKEKLLMIDGNEDFKCISRLPNHFESD
ncbi:uncharacterized protein [Clytia hemisphaerica]|uniref:uncharacterized protein n=1 Tax=Clytia hemisphaerica TaxID=252671 RepID=UPI0034D3A325|eukprot:TCONS_00025746-protein